MPWIKVRQQRGIEQAKVGGAMFKGVVGEDSAGWLPLSRPVTSEQRPEGVRGTAPRHPGRKALQPEGRAKAEVGVCPE